MRTVIISTLLCLGCLQADYYLFTPPKDWEIADPKLQLPHVKINFFGQPTAEYRPSLNLATEEIDGSLGEYIENIRQIHEADPNNRWRDLGKYPTLDGESRLIEIEKKSEIGQLRVLQLITLKDRTVYLLSAAAPKEKFFHHYKDFQEAFRSVKFTPDLFHVISNPSKQATLRQQYDTMMTAKKREKEEPWTVFEAALLSAVKEEFSRLHITFKESSVSASLWLKFQEAAIQSMRASFTQTYQEFSEQIASLPPSEPAPSAIEEMWLSFQQIVITEYKELGAYWQLSLLQSARNQLDKE
jgi:hypothetical protein